MNSLATACQGEMATDAASPQPSQAAKRANRRLQKRVAINSRLFICYEDRQSLRHRVRARAVETSASGILVQSEEAVAVGTIVHLQTANFIAMGKASVRHCTQKGLMYRIGLYVPDRLVRSL